MRRLSKAEWARQNGHRQMKSQKWQQQQEEKFILRIVRSLRASKGRTPEQETEIQQRQFQTEVLYIANFLQDNCAGYHNTCDLVISKIKTLGVSIISDLEKIDGFADMSQTDQVEQIKALVGKGADASESKSNENDGAAINTDTKRQSYGKNKNGLFATKKKTGKKKTGRKNKGKSHNAAYRNGAGR